MKTVLLDLDGVVIRRYRKRPGMAGWEALKKLFTLLDWHPCRIICITDRPSGQLPYFCWLFHGARYHFGELGSTCYDRDENRIVIHPNFQAFAKNVRPNIIDVLREKCDLGLEGGPTEEPGGKLVTISMERPLGESGQFFPERVQRAVEPWANQVYFDLEGSAVSVYPNGLSKVTALLWAFQLMDFAPKETIWVADGKRDIPLAQELRLLGGTVGSVGNGHSDFKAVSQIVTHAEYEEGLFQILQQFLS